MPPRSRHTLQERREDPAALYKRPLVARKKIDQRIEIRSRKFRKDLLEHALGSGVLDQPVMNDSDSLWPQNEIRAHAAWLHTPGLAGADYTFHV